MSNKADPLPPVAEGFLAVAKDCRYVAAATHLIIQILEAWQIQHSPADAWYASALLYAVLVLKRKQRTLGMDVTGLRYKIESSSSSSSSSLRTTIRSMVGISTIYMLHRWVRPRLQNPTWFLRGSQRLQAFEQRRRAMIQRAQSEGYSTSRINDNNNSARNITSDADESVTISPQERATGSAPSRVKEIMRKACQQILEHFMMFQTGGPHDLFVQHFVSPASWWLRLYAAYYCLDGRFPSFGHYLLGQQVVAAIPDEKRLVNRPHTHRLAALLILSHATGVALQAFAKTVMQWSIHHILRSASLHQHNVSTQQLQDSSSPSSMTNTFSGQEPCGSCAICQQPRENPACPIQCGHVFCWECLQKWIRFRSECPVCRTASRPQDIVALCNYRIPKEEEVDKKYRPPNHDS